MPPEFANAVRAAIDMINRETELLESLDYVDVHQLERAREILFEQRRMAYRLRHLHRELGTYDEVRGAIDRGIEAVERRLAS